MRVALLGFGLIGGSVARALAGRDGSWQVAAWSPGGGGPAAAAADGVIARATASIGEAVRDAQLVVLAAPPLACLDLLDRLAGPDRAALPRDATVTDVASTKRRLVAHAAAHDLPFVGGHPMAGREATGYAASDAALFEGRPWVVCTDDDVRAEPVERLALAVGAVPIRLAADEHDAAVAAISHLPLAVAAALVEAVGGGADARPDWPAAHRLAASGWRDTTRLARGDVAMGAGIAATNGDLLAARLRDLRVVLDGWIADLEGDVGGDAIARRLAAARARLEEPPA